MELPRRLPKGHQSTTFELPGTKSDDVTIDVHQNRLTVAGGAKKSYSHEEGEYAVREGIWKILPDVVASLRDQGKRTMVSFTTRHFDAHPTHSLTTRKLR